MTYTKVIKQLFILTLILLGGWVSAEPRIQDGTVAMPDSGLMWVRDAAVVRSSGFSPGMVLPLMDASAFISALNRGDFENSGYSDWRLPTRSELQKLQDRYHAVSPGPFLNLADIWFWSSEDAAIAGLISEDSVAGVLAVRSNH